MVWYWTKWTKTGRLVEDITADDISGIVYFTTGIGVYRVVMNGPAVPARLRILEDNLQGIVHHANQIYLSAPESDKIFRHDLLTKSTSVIAYTNRYTPAERKFAKPQGITISNNGHILFTESHSVRMIQISQDIMSLVAGSHLPGHKDGNASDAQFCHPTSIANGKDGTIYVADNGNQCIRAIKLGIVSTIAGVPKTAGFLDGPSSTALFKNITGIAILGSNLLVVDNNRIRRVDLNRNLVSTPPQFKDIKNAVSITITPKGTMYIGTAGKIYQLQSSWKWERFLWIGKIKEDSNYCTLASLPSEIIKEIAWFVALKCTM